METGCGKNGRIAEEKESFDRRISEDFTGWFNNHMAIFLMMVQYGIPGETRSVLRAELFFHDLEHHFMNPDPGKQTCDAFRWLRRYLALYPNVRKKHLLRAFMMVGRIYRTFGMELRSQPGSRESITREGVLICARNGRSA